MNPDESLNQDPMDASMPPSSSEPDDYKPQPLPDVLSGRSNTSTEPPSGSVVSDPWTTEVDSPDEPEVIEVDGLLETVESLEADDSNVDDRSEAPQTLMAEGLEIIEDLMDEPGTAQDLENRVSDLRREEQQLRQQVASLQQQLLDAQVALGNLVKEGLSELEHRKQTLQISVEQLERRQERIRAEMRSTFAGSSQELAIRIQGFKDYLVGSLQDLVSAAEDLKLAPPPAPEPSRRPQREAEETAAPKPQFAEQGFQEAARMIRKSLDQYRNSPDYYGPPWQLRRTFEPIHAERVSNWFFEQGGRGAVRSMGSRLQNILIASAAISILHRMYGDRIRTLVLSDSPERLGEWRRGLQDCLGLGRMDFGTDQGVTLFDAPEPLSQRADRLVKQKYLPLIIIDESEGVIDLSLLQFPLWLAFAADPTRPNANLY
ncbi:MULTISPECIES: DUF3086 domain-containing protein [unclassified Leptolyngbya]|uniref:DUF3086 domain-containing protein n=1 Tax=unclassified Leptolyngbya TaxID=2650499 RepID=UPI001682DA7F|nr:DUF3086 domain-containing protein [Leptolyngbya sp. FACHB-8]MBD2155410.1 DUF3086 domain-containing protein [Leptolyngbya sp. FACHB-16]